ncbi:flavin-containing monooxygenase 5-like [Diadema setosum]|uniref:flavin-containing monooxygenase 5-like n=1 Tax=Diadema setosum TaxID=31175 RepID=UPI003B3A8FA7
MRRVAVIGAGASGLVSLKICLEEGLEAVCYEKKHDIGGIWLFAESEEPRPDPKGPGAVYFGLHTNVSKEMMAYSDYAFDNTLPPFIRAPDLLAYYRGYADHFKLRKHIRFNTEVVDVQPTKDFSETGRWLVTVRSESGAETTETFDGVVVSTGIYSNGWTPEIPGVEGFPGTIIHSCQFVKGEDFKNKRVLVVGGSISAADLATVVSPYASQVYLSMRRGAWLWPLTIRRRPWNYQLNRRWHELLPDSYRAKRMQSVLEEATDHMALGLQCPNPAALKLPMINAGLSDKIMNGDVRVRSGIQRVEGSTVILNDGSAVEDIDVIIFATGYDVKYPFLRFDLIPGLSADVGPLTLFKHVVPIELSPCTLQFTGMAVPDTMGQNIMSEMQARLAVSVLKKQARLPDMKSMKREIDCVRESIVTAFGPRNCFVPDPPKYMDEIAGMIGTRPSLLKLLLTDPKLAYHYYIGWVYPPSYRLVGPGATPKAREELLRLENDSYHSLTLSTVRPDAVTTLKSSQSSFYLKWLMFAALIAIVIAFVMKC